MSDGLPSTDPTIGGEANKTRPAILVSNDHANSRAASLGRGTVTVVPVTSTIDPALAFHVLLPAEASGLDRDSKAQAEHVRSIDVRRLVHPVGHLPIPLVRAVDTALRLHLDLN